MHTHSLARWTQGQAFLASKHVENERKIWRVVLLTTTVMVVEIFDGMLQGSMALVADGWPMSTHAAALAFFAFVYRYARAHAHDARFTFGPGKLGELAGYSSALIIFMIIVRQLRSFRPDQHLACTPAGLRKSDGPRETRPRRGRPGRGFVLSNIW